MALANSARCKYCLNHTLHPVFVFILTDRRLNHLADKNTQAIVAKIDCSRHPILKLNCHNRKKNYRVGPSAKSTKAGAGQYQIEFAVGPFSKLHYALRFQRIWALERRANPRLIAGLKLAKKHKATVYARDKQWLIEFGEKHLS